MPASTASSSTLESTDLTSASSVTGSTVRSFFWNSAVAAAPHGTAGAQTASLTPGLATSARVVTPAGLPGGVATSSTLVAKFCGSEASPASVTVLIVLVLAAAKTSAGEPLTTCCARSELAPKL